MRIAIVTESFLPEVNGVTNSVLRILEQAQQLGHQVLVIAPESPTPGPQMYAGFAIKRVPSLVVKGMIPLGIPQRKLEPLIEGFDPDVIHLASPIFLGYYIARIANRMKIPTVSIYQTDIAGFASNYGLTLAYSTLQKWVAKIHSKTTLTLAPSTWALNELRQSDVTAIKIWQRGVNSVRFNPHKRDHDLRKVLSDDGKKIIVGYVGRLANEKQIEDLAVLDERKDVQLVIVGDGPIRSRLERALPNALFFGHQSGEELAKIYASLDIFVHTGKHETFCQTIQEALASGVPVIAPNSGGPLDLVNHGVTGYLIDTGNENDLEAAFENIKYNAQIEKMRYLARASVVDRSWEKINSELFEHYRLVIEESKNTIKDGLVA